MLDINKIRNEFNVVKDDLSKRNIKFVDMLQNIYEDDKTYRQLLIKKESISARRNQLSKEVAYYKNQGDDVRTKEIMNEVASLKYEFEEVEKKTVILFNKINELMLSLPNIPHQSVPTGRDENDNIEVKKWSSPTKFNFNPKAHWDLASSLKLVDFERAVKLTGSRFTCYTNYGAKLIRALSQYTLDMNSEAGFTEMLPPVILNADSLTGTGQLPKFEEDLFKLTNNYYLSPTAEVQLTNYFRNEILSIEQLPFLFTANTSCFRSEAGSAGKDTKGVIRQHQFYKTEMVILSHPSNSYEHHEFMTRQAEKLLEGLELPYRKIVLCSGDMGFGAAKTYDIEVWLPSYNSYKEISSCSNCEDFQARRMKLRYRDNQDKIYYIHTLNGSGLAIDRLWAAVVENYQQADGSIKVPKALQKYLNNMEYITNGK